MVKEGKMERYGKRGKEGDSEVLVAGRVCKCMCVS